MQKTDQSASVATIAGDERLLSHLPPETLAARLMELPTRQRLDLLLERQDAALVVGALAEQDFYLFVRELGEYEAAPLLALARFEQFNHILDMEGWKGDAVQGGRALVWCSLMAEANLAGLFSWVWETDIELFFLLFQQWIEVLPFPEDEQDETEAMDRVPSLTIDGQFYFRVRYPGHEHTIRQLLQALFEEDRSQYQKLMLHLQQGADAEVAELAYRFHRGRLEDLAIPVLAEARHIYLPLRSGQVLPKKGIPLVDDYRAPNFVLALAPREGLLAHAMAGITEVAVREGIRLELTSLANKVVVADELATEDPLSLRVAVAKVTAFVELGLAVVAGGEVGQAPLILQRLFLEDIFRLGYTGLAEVAARLATMRREGWLRDWPHGLAILDQQWEERAALLAGPTPMILRPGVGPESEPMEDYPRTLADLQEAGEFVAMLEALAPVYAALRADWPAGWDPLAGMLWPEAQARTLTAVTLGALVCTAAARSLWQGVWRVAPLPVSSWPVILPLLTPDALGRAVAGWLRELLPTEEGYLRAGRYLAPLFAHYAVEMAALDPTTLPDPRFMHLFLFTAAKE
jgi:hypothetical protein